MDASRRAPSDGRLRRLAEELEDDGYGFVLESEWRDVVLEELDYAVRPPVHERRVPSYGAIVSPATSPEAWTVATELYAERLPTAEFGDAEIRRFADGISSWAIHNGRGVDELVVFDRSAGSERDLVILSGAADATIVQRHPSGIVRVVGSWGVVRRDLTGWHHEPPLTDWLESIPGCRVGDELTVLGRLLAFAVHDLGARGIGALLVLHPTGEIGVGHEARLPIPPALAIDRPHDLAPLRHALGQTDGATIFDRAGVLRRLGVRLVPSAEAEQAVPAVGGTRHISAHRYSYDDPDAVVIVVSEDGPVTVLRGGVAQGRARA